MIPTQPPTDSASPDVRVEQADWNLANLCVPAAVIFAEEVRHVQDLRRRAAEHIARHRLAALASPAPEQTDETAALRAERDRLYALAKANNDLARRLTVEKNALREALSGILHWRVPHDDVLTVTDGSRRAIAKGLAALTPEPKA